MAEPFLSEIRLMSFVFAPKGWALCNGQLLPINQNQALFSLLGTTFGGDGRVNFALPDLRGRAPIHVGSGHTLGERGGEQAHTLSIAELPTHTHVAQATTVAATTNTPTNTVMLAQSTAANLYASGASNLVAMAANAVSNVGGSQAHLNMQPFLTLSFCIALPGHLPEPELRREPMAQPYVGEIRMFAGNFAPAGWMFCEGQLLPISENETLFQLIGTTYGGDGQSTFALPDLRGRIPIHQGNGFILAETGGVEEVTLTVNQIAAHSHALLATQTSAAGTAPSPNVVLAVAAASTITPYGTDNPTTPLHANSMTSVGGSQPHTNFQPYLCVDFIISLFGIFPSPT